MFIYEIHQETEKIMSTLTSLIRRAPKRFSAVMAIIAAAIIIPTAVLASWGPDRPTYNWDGEAANHVVFNSFVDNPVQGDERNFMQVREATAGADTYADDISLQDGKEYVINMYYHNNASTSLNGADKNYAGIARNAYVKAEIPGLVQNGSNGTVAQGYIGASNASPQEVWDDVKFKNTSGGDIALKYVPGSATINNFGNANGMKLSDAIVTSGAPIGYDSLNGDVPGCNEFSGYVTFKIKAVQSNFTIEKDVRIAGETEYKENVIAQPGDTLEYRIQYKNTGSITHKNVVIKDTLPAHVSYIPGSTTLKNSNNPNGKTISDTVTTTGVNIGDYGAGSNAFVKFNAKVAGVNQLECGTNTLTNTARVQVGDDTKDDTASTTVTKECEPGKINVCELETNKIITINEADFDNSKHSNNLDDCKTTNEITVCELATKTIVTIDEANFDSTKYSKDLNDCELPQTGMTENIVAIVGLSALVASIAYYVASRRALVQ